MTSESSRVSCALAPVERVHVSTCRIPTDSPESDGTFAWDATTIVIVQVEAGGCTGVGYTYGASAVATLIEDELVDVVRGSDPALVVRSWDEMSARLRNLGRPGVGMMAVSAVDVALWDLRARLLDVPLTGLLGAARDAVPIYGSGGFTSYSPARVAEQLGAWADAGIPRVKLKVGRHPDDDPARLDAARAAIGDDVELFVDANGAFRRTAATRWAHRYRGEWGVSWFEEPVTSDDVEGLRGVRETAPVGLDVAAGEYAFLLDDARALLDAGAVDCLQVDVTRCGGITGLARVTALADAYHVDVSAHCAPAVSAHAFCAARHVRHLEYFHDHVRIEAMLFDGTLEPSAGELRPDPSRPGLGLEFKHADAAGHRTAERR